MKKVIIFLVTILSLALASCSKKETEPKYVFYFIGDGMGMSHIAATRAALASQRGVIGFDDLSFTKFPVINYITTHCATRLTTDSAAAGTALSTGTKTYPGAIGVDTAKQALRSIAYDMKDWGRKVAIITSVSIDHATPAAFYAHQPNRNMSYEIALELPRSGFDVFASSGFLKPNDIYDSLSAYGYTLVSGKDAELVGDKIVWCEKENKAGFAYAIDRESQDMTLPEVVEKTIKHFGACEEGFFMMAEGGQIDWAAHANDAPAIIEETIDFSEAIQKAVDFYNEHPDETLIIVTADHETGGFALGRSDRGYDTDMKVLFERNKSRNKNDDDDIANINDAHFRAGVNFTTGSHTASPVPLFVLGAGSEKYRLAFDNTDIVKILREMHASAVAK